MDELVPGKPFCLLNIGVSSSGKSRLSQYIASKFKPTCVYVVQGSGHYPKYQAIDFADIASLPPSSLLIVEDLISPTRAHLNVLKSCLCEYKHHRKLSLILVCHTVMKMGIYSMAGFFTHLSVPKSVANQLVFSNVARSLHIPKAIWEPAWKQFMAQPDSHIYLLYNIGTCKYNTCYVYFPPPSAVGKRTKKKMKPDPAARSSARSANENDDKKQNSPEATGGGGGGGSSGRSNNLTPRTKTPSISEPPAGKKEQHKEEEEEKKPNTVPSLDTYLAGGGKNWNNSKELALLLRAKLLPILEACAIDSEHTMRAVAFYDYLMAGALDPRTISPSDLALNLHQAIDPSGRPIKRRVSLCDYIFYVTSTKPTDIPPINCLLLHRVILRKGVAIPSLFVKNPKFVAPPNIPVGEKRKSIGSGRISKRTAPT